MYSTTFTKTVSIAVYIWRYILLKIHVFRFILLQKSTPHITCDNICRNYNIESVYSLAGTDPFSAGYTPYISTPR